MLCGRWRIVGPSEPPFGGRLQTTSCCVSGNAIVVSDEEKAPVRRQVGIRKSIAVDASLLNQVTSEPGVTFWPGRSLAGVPMTGQMVSGVEATRAWSAAFAWNVGRPVPTLPLLVGRGEGALQAEAPRGVEYRRGTWPADRFVVVVKAL